MKLWLVILSFCFQFALAQSADSTRALRFAVGAEVIMYSSSMYALNNLWYKDYPKSKFHWINDNSNWLQMDKIGHATTAYNVGLLGRDMMLWAGVSEKKALWYGGLYGAVFLTTIETLDGFSKEWGASWGDLLANTTGTFVFIGQELAFNQQIIQMKYSFFPSKYADSRPDLLGENLIQQSIKDYNAQIYWLSISINSIYKTAFPNWLNIALGYGADGMLNGSVDEANSSREFYLSLDLNLRKIDTKSRFLDKTLKVLSFIKIPFPAFKFNSNSIKFFPLHYGQ